MEDSLKSEFIHYAIEKVYFYIDSNFWSKLNVTRVQRWMNNFTTLDEQYCAAKLLDRFVYYSEEDTIQLLKHGLNDLFIREEFLCLEEETDFQLGDSQFDDLKNSYIKETAIMPLSEGNPTESSHAIARILSNEIGFPESNILNPQSMELEYIKKFKRILIVDDFVGTGDQIIEFWNFFDVCVDGNNVKMFELARDIEEIRIEYFCLVVTEEGYKRFYSEELAHDKSLNIRYCEMLKEKFKIFGAKSVYFNQDEIEDCKKILEKLVLSKGINLSGWRGLDYAIAFHHCIPDASLPLFYEKQEDWNYLIRNKTTQEHVEI